MHKFLYSLQCINSTIVLYLSGMYNIFVNHRRVEQLYGVSNSSFCFHSSEHVPLGKSGRVFKTNLFRNSDSKQVMKLPVHYTGFISPPTSPAGRKGKVPGRKRVFTARN